MPESDALSPLLLDACVVINFAASRRFEELAAACNGFSIVDVVVAEAHFVRKGGTADDANEREAIVLDGLIDTGHLRVEDAANDEELDAFVRFAADLGDGESMTLAIALHRGHNIVTDDRKASRIAAAHGIKITSTLEVLRTWAMTADPGESEIRRALVDLRERGRYVPPQNHPLRYWWDQHINQR